MEKKDFSKKTNPAQKPNPSKPAAPQQQPGKVNNPSQKKPTSNW